jgi:hypothetical protein
LRSQFVTSPAFSPTVNGKAKSFGNRPAEGVNRVMDGLRDWGGVENRPVPGG